MSISLNSPKYADTKSLSYQMHKKQQDRKRRKNPFEPQAEERFFRHNEGGTDHIDGGEIDMSGTVEISMTFNTSDARNSRWLCGFHNSSTDDYFGIIIGKNGAGLVGFSSNARTPGQTTQSYDDGISHNLVATVDTTSGQTLIYIDGALVSTSNYTAPAALTGLWDFFIGNHKNSYASPLVGGVEGVLSDTILSIGGVSVREYDIASNGDLIPDKTGNQDGTVINGNADDWGLFKETPTSWEGQNLNVPPWDSVDQELIKA